MNKVKEIVIDGNNFDDMESFYDEVERKICPEFDGFGRNLDALNDVLYGGFITFELEEQVVLIWRNFNKSKREFNKKEFDLILEIIQANKHIKFITI